MIPYANEKDAQYEESVDKPDLYDDKEKKRKWSDRILLNRPSKVVVTLLITAIVLPIILYQYLLSNTLDLPPSDGLSTGSCLLPRENRLPCGHGNVTQAQCHTQCCYDLTNHLCYHRLPSRFSYVMDRSWTEESNLQPRVATDPFAFQPSITNFQLSMDEVSETHVKISFYNPLLTEARHGSRIESKGYTYEVSSPELNVEVAAQQGILFTTLRGPLIAANDIWEVTFKLTDEAMYGFGEIPITTDTVKVIYSHKGGLSSVPLIFAKLNGSYHGLLIDVESPTEVIFQGDNQIIVRSITSAKLEFHVFIGPEPKDVMEDVKKLIGFENQLEYWMLGAHICSTMVDNLEESLSSLTNFMSAANLEQLPYESHCGVAPVILHHHCPEEEDTYHERAVALLIEDNKRYVPHISPYIRYTNVSEELLEGETRREHCVNIEEYHHVMLQNADANGTYIGTVDGEMVLYPNYGAINATDLAGKLWQHITEVAHGIVVENNWPLDETEKMVNETHLYLPYYSKNFEESSDGIPPWNITLPDGSRYLNKHNKYGDDFISVIRNISGPTLPISATSHWNNGRVAINRQAIDASWTSFRRELVEAALGGISGHWLWTSPICGDTEIFNPDTQTSLCVKWYSAATYLPLIKIHSDGIGRDPLSFVGNHKLYMIEALKVRISLLPYFYTVLQTGPLLRPMFYQFPNFQPTEDLNTQFSVGDDLLIVPNMLPDQSHVNAWMPPGTWFEIGSGLKMAVGEGEPITMATTEADFLTLIRGGSIVVMQKVVYQTAEETRLNSNFSITIALDCNSTENACHASGKVFMSYGMTLNLTADHERVTIKSEESDFGVMCEPENVIWTNVIKEFNIFGLGEESNNYDHHKYVESSIDLCELTTAEEIIFVFN